MSGIYWGLTIMDLIRQLHCMNREEILTFIKSCQHECGGISASIGHDLQLLYLLVLFKYLLFAAAAAKLLQSCPTLCDPIDGSPLGSPVPGILQARTLEWVAISFSNT